MEHYSTNRLLIYSIAYTKKILFGVKEIKVNDSLYKRINNVCSIYMLSRVSKTSLW